MNKRVKTGGRVAGTPNKRTQAVTERLEELDCDPIAGMARIAKQAEEAGEMSLAGQMYKELAPYIAPKRRAIEQTILTEPKDGAELRNAAIRELINSGLSRKQAENIADGKPVNTGTENLEIEEVRH